MPGERQKNLTPPPPSLLRKGEKEKRVLLQARPSLREGGAKTEGSSSGSLLGWERRAKTAVSSSGSPFPLREGGGGVRFR
jgi:hypothetical protein